MESGAANDHANDRGYGGDSDRTRDQGSAERNAVGRLDVEAFKRRSRHLREIYLNPEKRHVYDWTNTEKKILLLDWYHNPAYYEEWKPLETEDIMNKFFSNMVYNFNHLSMVNVGTTVLFMRLLRESQQVRLRYQAVALVQRYFRPNSSFYDEFKVGLLWPGPEFQGYLDAASVDAFDYPAADDYQCIVEGMQFNVFGLTDDEFERAPPCARCVEAEVALRTALVTPKIVFPEPVTSMELTTTFINGNRNYLLAVRMGARVKMYNITDLVALSLRVCSLWEQLRQSFAARVRESVATFEDVFCSGCLLSEADLEQLDRIKNLTNSFSVNPAVSLLGLDGGELSWKSVSVMRNTLQTGLKFFYTSVLNISKVLPTFVASVGLKRACIWNIAQVPGSANEPFKVLDFPEGSVPTDISASLSVVESLEDLLNNRWLLEPKVYTTDDTGHLRLWSLSKGLECLLKVDNVPLLSLDVNKKYPHLIALGGDSGKLKIFNTHLQAMAAQEPEDGVGLVTLPSYLPTVVYQYLRWYHPIVKIKWVNDVFVACQHSQPLFAQESTNAASLVIWNVLKDIFDREDAFLCNKYWSQSMEAINISYHLGSKLMCLYGGHFGSLGGILASDVTWTKEFGLLAVSSDATGQLHWYKPGAWTWADSDDPMCLARIKSDLKFHEDVLATVQKEFDSILTESLGVNQGTSSYRKTRSNYADYIEEAKAVLKQIEEAKPLLNDFKSLPSWSKRTLRLTADEEKYMKMIRKELRDREKAEHNLVQSKVQRG